MKKLIICIATVVAVVCGIVFVSCGHKDATVAADGSCNIKAAVIGSGTEADEIYNQLKYGTMANINVYKENNTDNIDGYDIIYLTGDADVSAVESYVSGGGTAVLDNGLVRSYPAEFIGAAEIVDIEGCPAQLSYPESEEDLQPISDILYSYTNIFREYVNFDKYLEYSYGVGIIPSSAHVIAEYNGVGLYTINKYGAGNVFVTNPLLPGKYTVSEFLKDEAGEPFAVTTSAAGTILRNGFAEYVSKQKYGFAVERTYGSYGSRPASWELHYEDITGIQNDSLEEFADLCMGKWQIPSYTLARNFYTWFKRAESLTYLELEGGRAITDPYEGAYCSGTHVAADGKWLELDCYTDTESYFEDDPKYTKRLYPCPIDWNEDGNIDFICGSADGKFYYFEGKGMGDNYETGIPVFFTDENGAPLSAGTYSSPVIFDINGDGRGELISGSEDGLVRQYISLKTDENPWSMAFKDEGVLLDTGMPDAMVDVGDLNGDSKPDIAVGSRTGELRVYFGHASDRFDLVYDDYITVNSGQQWIAPCIYNGKLYGGTLEGYVAEYGWNGGTYDLIGYMGADRVSRRGNDRVTIGMNCVPRFADIDGDGNDELVCGSLEYGMAYPTDSSYFPAEKQLKAQIEFCEDNDFYVGVHGYTNKYASPETEAEELEMQKKSFEKYGIKWDGKGVNQHTWFTSQFGYDRSGADGYNPSYNGTFAAQRDSGLLWNSGFTPPESRQVPESCAENSLPMPIYAADSDFLIMQVSNTPHGDGRYSYESVQYGMPMLFYNHCDYIYEKNDAKAQKDAVNKVAKLVDEYDYMFVTEEQMAKSVSASYNADISAQIREGRIIISADVRDRNAALYDEDYSGCVGVKVVFADRINAVGYSSDSDVEKTEGNSIYVTLDKTVTLTQTPEKRDMLIKELNVPADIEVNDGGADISFKKGGLMCVRIKGNVTTSSDGWDISSADGDTIFRKFGKAQKLTILK